MQDRTPFETLVNQIAGHLAEVYPGFCEQEALSFTIGHALERELALIFVQPGKACFDEFLEELRAVAHNRAVEDIWVGRTQVEMTAEERMRRKKLFWPWKKHSSTA